MTVDPIAELSPSWVGYILKLIQEKLKDLNAKLDIRNWKSEIRYRKLKWEIEMYWTWK